MASLDQPYTLTLDTTQARADVAVLNAEVDALLLKLERVKELCGTLTHNVTITASGRQLAGVLQVEADRLGRVIGRDQAIVRSADTGPLGENH